MTPIQQWAQRAIWVQDAVNLSGVVLDFANFMQFLCDEYPDFGTVYRNKHPISVLFSDKIASLTGSFAVEEYQSAYEWCKLQLEEVDK
jgi:hypothetical protein